MIKAMVIVMTTPAADIKLIVMVAIGGSGWP